MSHSDESQLSNPRRVGGLFSLLARYKWLFCLSAFTLTVSIFFRTLSPRILQLVVDYVIVLPITSAEQLLQDQDSIIRALLFFLPDPDDSSLLAMLWVLALMYVVISMIQGGFLFASNVFKAAVSERIAKDLRDTVFAHIQRLPLSVFGHFTRGEMIQRSTGDVDTVKRFFHKHLVNVLRIGAIFFFSFGMMAIADFQYALICVCLMPFILLTSYLFFQRDKKIWKAHEEESDRLNNMVQENLNGIRTVSAYANEKFEIRRFGEQNEKYREMSLTHNLMHSWFWSLTDFLSFSQIVISIIVGGIFVAQGRITVGELLSFFTYINMVTWPMRDLGRILSDLGMAQVALKRLHEILGIAEEERRGTEQSAFRGALRFENVSFRYTPDEPLALENVSFEIKPGEKVAIIGPTGAGKSTLIRLLLRLYEPTEGRIYLDGRPLETYARPYLRHKIGTALQKAFLFSSTIHENIAYTSPGAEAERVFAAAQKAQLNEVKRIFPKGYDTMVGEKGVSLSGGQKQRVALARTLLGMPDLLVLDGVTSALDTQTEQAVFRAIEQNMQGKTTLIISHRITSIQKAQRILVLSEGKLIQQGSPVELEQEAGYYQEIHKIQSAVEDEIANLN